MNSLTRLRNLAMAGLLGAGVLLGGSQQASAVTFGFDIAGVRMAGHAYASSFTLDVTDLGAGKALFQIVSAGAPAMNYFTRTVFMDDLSPSAFLGVP